MSHPWFQVIVRSWISLPTGAASVTDWSSFLLDIKNRIGLFELVLCVCPLQSVEGEHHEKAVELLKAAKDSVKLVVRYTPKVLEEMEARFEKLRTARRRQQQQLLMQQQQQQNLATQQNHMS